MHTLAVLLRAFAILVGLAGVVAGMWINVRYGWDAGRPSSPRSQEVRSAMRCTLAAALAIAGTLLTLIHVVEHGATCPTLCAPDLLRALIPIVAIPIAYGAFTYWAGRDPPRGDGGSSQPRKNEEERGKHPPST